ncbi:HPr kinase/phosphorylase [Williamsoniiplasma somnilux]|uniref:HPr kinase/phosphorylase n=1 Tax=Williamsoniiplasma somnilux TaxID=215578 RepID=A0A2K8P1Z2_9MOLU|nr:HPr(Ser) kinase/phosphatase [Williamsoniiplasma somnilux]ATZ19031.1 HPr kinase/phosphorylase [Williamsoniiplasma somnilux]
MKKLFLKHLTEKFPFQVLAGKDKIDSTQILVYGLNRAGLELTGYFVETGDKSKRAVLMSSKEYKYISQFNEQQRAEKYKKLINSGIPTIIFTQKFEDKLLIDVARELDFPLLSINTPSTSEFTQRILDYFDLFFAPQIEVHGSLVNIYGKGILITGESGIGKSEVTIDLIKKNHLFVGDDRIILINKSNNIYGKSHPILRNLIEVRGIGIMDISKTNGNQVLIDETKIDLIIELFKFGENGVDDADRLGREYLTKSVLGIDVPYIRIPVSSGRNIANLIESAVAQLKIKQSTDNEDVIALMNKRLNEEV